MMPLMRALDTLVLLDSIKDTKACFSNDFAAYERAYSHPPAATHPSQ